MTTAPTHAYNVRFLPSGKTAAVPAGATLRDAAALAAVPLSFPCGGEGRCLNCRVRILDGLAEISDWDRRAFSAPDIERGFRLACRLPVLDDLTVECQTEVVTDKREHGTEGVRRPVFAVRTVDLPPPTLALQKTAAERAFPGGGAAAVARDALADLARLEQEGVRRFSALCRGEAVLALGRDGRFAGIAIDIGTTTVAATLVDLATGETLAAAGALNAQASFGADVISRIKHTIDHAGGTAALARAVLATIEETIDETCRAAGLGRERIAALAMAGNPAMIHLALGLAPAGLARAPYVGVTPGGFTLTARELGLAVYGPAPVFVLPSIASNIGSDLIADLLVARIEEHEGVSVLIDLGTNAEIVAGNAKALCACSTAAGPAFEGATISCGMRAGTGAVDRVAWSEEDGLAVHAIGDVPPRGICGSGLLDLAAVLRQAGIIDPTGRLLPPAELPPGVPDGLARHIVANGKTTAFDLGGIAVTAGDIRQLQLAKGAVAAGVRTLLEHLGTTEDRVETVLLAGAFGSFVRVESARAIGLVPPGAAHVAALGNAAGRGARLALLCDEARERARSLAARITYVELAGNPVWRTHFAEAMRFPE